MSAPPSTTAAPARRRTGIGRWTFGAAGVALLITATACSDGDGATLQVYSGRHYDIERAFTEFSEDTGVDVEFLTGNDAELRERIAAEGEDTEADVFLTVDAGNLAAAADDGLFQPLESPVLDAAIPAEYRDPQDRWFGLALRTRTIVYNPETVDEAEVPATYEELARPEWAGRLCLRNANNSYQQSLVASMLAANGEAATLEVLRGWADNAEIFANDVELLQAMAAGACDVGIANHYYLAQQLEDDPGFPVELKWAEQEGRGVHVNVSGGGVTANADDPELAKRFLEWLATDGQGALVHSNHEYPANPTVAADELITAAFGVDYVRDALNASEYGRLNPEAVRLMDEANFG